jgi:TolB protein
MKRLFHAAVLFLLILPARAETPLFLELSAKGQKVDLGLAEFSVKDGDFVVQARQVRDVLKSDLAFPKTFNLLEGGGGSEKVKGTLSAWSSLGADVLVTGVVEKSLGRAQFTGVLRDVSSGDVLLQKKYALEDGNERSTAHAFADEIVKYFTGHSGVAGSRIVFVNDATGKKEVCMVDYDGQGFRRLTDDRSIALFPKPSPDGKWIAFTSFKEGWPTLRLLNVESKLQRSLCRFEGLNSSCAWLPDGQSLVATLSLGKDPSLYQVDLAGKILRVVTNNAAAADTAPCPSPDGLQLTFTSDRPGRPQIYLVNASGANLRRLTQTQNWCDSPVWSPQGNAIAFTMSERGKNFDIYTIEPVTGRVDRLTYGEGDNENAAWSPDGRWIAFTSTRRGRPELFVMGADGSNPRPVGDIPGRSFTPFWMN